MPVMVVIDLVVPLEVIVVTYVEISVYIDLHLTEHLLLLVKNGLNIPKPNRMNNKFE